MATIAQTLSRMEAWQQAEKAAGKAVAGTSIQQDQVHRSIPVTPMEDQSLGYRGIANNLESRSELLKKWTFLTLWELIQTYGSIEQKDSFD